METRMLQMLGWGYRKIARPLIFLFPSEPVHEVALRTGYLMTRVPGVGALLSLVFRKRHPALETNIAGLSLQNPIGLAAGFDYRAELPQLLPGLGFGFGTVGTLTHLPYEGNSKPRLGRLVRSQALLVNKGFKNEGVTATLTKHTRSTFSIPIGVSIGRTNTIDHTSQAEAVADVVKGFTEAEATGVRFSYYELNISCPNLRSPIEFYDPHHLDKLLSAVAALKLTRPIFIKMPIDRTEEQLTAMLDVIMKFNVAGIIIGNLQRNRAHPALIQDEVAHHGKGNFSGKATVEDSNQHIALAYRHTKGQLIIVGCGGVFTAEDALEKIRAGASLIQLASGLVFEGPLVASTINAGLVTLVKRAGYTHYRDAVGSAHRAL